MNAYDFRVGGRVTLLDDLPSIRTRGVRLSARQRGYYEGQEVVIVDIDIDDNTIRVRDCRDMREPVWVCMEWVKYYDTKPVRFHVGDIVYMATKGINVREKYDFISDENIELWKITSINKHEDGDVFIRFGGSDSGYNSYGFVKSEYIIISDHFNEELFTL